MGKVNKVLLMLIAMAAIMLAAVGINKVTLLYSDRKWEQERIVRYEEASASVAEIQTVISELAQDKGAIASFLEENRDYFEDMEGARETFWAEEEADFETEDSEEVSGNELEDESDEAGDVSGNLLEVESEEGLADISGNILDTVFGDEIVDVSGNQLGTVSGNELYDVSGNQLGSVSGNQVYDISGNLFMDVSGNLLSEESGNLFAEILNALHKLLFETEREDEGEGEEVDHSEEIQILKELTLQEKRQLRTSYMETVLQEKADREIIEKNPIDFSEIKITCIGDSLTEATNLDSLEDYRQYAYPARLKEILGAERVTNLGIGGSSIGRYWDNAFVDRYKEIPEDTDLIIIYGGANDGFCASEKEIGSMEERQARTFYGDLDELIRGIKSDYPKAMVVIATPLPNVLHDMLKKERDYLVPQSTLVEAIKLIAQEYDVPVIDLYNSNILDTHDAAVIYNYMPDGVHCNQDGYEILARHFAAELIKIYEQKGQKDEQGI